MKRKDSLRTAVQNFRQWTATVAKGRPLYGEWEFDYPDFDQFLLTAADALRSDSAMWDAETKDLLLYAVARDNEAETLADSLSEDQIDALAPALTGSDEPDAKWQIGDRLAKLPSTALREAILRSLASDASEYVRRRIANALSDSLGNRLS